MTTITTRRRGELSGRTVETIIRREYGTQARPHVAAHTEPYWGEVITPTTEPHQYEVLDVIIYVNGELHP